MITKPTFALIVAASVSFATGCNEPAPKLAADAIYTGGDIVTVNDSQPTVEAVAVKDGKILAVGGRAEIERH